MLSLGDTTIGATVTMQIHRQTVTTYRGVEGERTGNSQGKVPPNFHREEASLVNSCVDRRKTHVMSFRTAANSEVQRDKQSQKVSAWKLRVSPCLASMSNMPAVPVARNVVCYCSRAPLHDRGIYYYSIKEARAEDWRCRGNRWSTLELCGTSLASPLSEGSSSGRKLCPDP
jgi:hypothetical protein